MISSKRPDYNWLILTFVALKILLNLLAMPHFGFHRDELLHLVLADHLDWGYKEVPPFIAVLAYTSKHLFGTSVFAARVFPTICSGLIMWLTGRITVEMGGRKFAVILACVTMLAAPAFVASQYLFQPVVFDQFWWVLAAWLLIRYINTQKASYLYWLGACVGFGMLTKYSMAFFTFALILGLLISKQRRILFSKQVFIAFVIAFVIFLPNVIWQFAHHLPFINHMHELKEQQLDYNHPSDFIAQNFLVNGIALFVWLAGFIFLLISFRLRKFQFLAFAYMLVFLFLLLMNGKAYYLFGAYPMLFAAGGIAYERLLKSAGTGIRTTVAVLFTVPNLLLLPLLLPVLNINQTLGWFSSVGKLHFFDFAVTWEDKKKHPLTQDYADMFGWDEMAKKVGDTYHNLTPEQQKHTVIFASNYGQAGALHQYAEQYHIPKAISLNSSFTLWAPDSLHFEHMIYVNATNESEIGKLGMLFGSAVKTGEVTTPYAREKGTAIFLLSQPKQGLYDRYNQELAKKRMQ
ncbi:glycosyltransferase family 39 protein [Mucilaginibacter mali]|uniref:Glycosyltransferase family 39 protein n=1 Tax=Mucilaginibacter mali TaxID=2740462 RepID=A0A7D4Q1V3_9SPHI|nr:glycosyltransferase family 39 protein [Mucilaginibacter mali]QKJ29227.1 glycosyltransferase family 39 protein [Mucilaginibacter mali]